jgi:3-oxoacyl-[acyl-carrier protein] reductase
MKLHGRAAIVTGASRGVGKATALALAEKGCSVLINYRFSVSEAEEVARAARQLGVKAVAFQADTADEAACRGMVRKAVEAFGRLDILVNNAATTSFVPHDQLDALNDELWDRIFNVNVKGPFYCVRAARPHLEQHHGEVVNVSSIAGITGAGSSIPYCASKAALICMNQSLARSLGPKIRVNSVAPGFIISRWTEEGLGHQFEEAKHKHEKGSALGKVCTPEDVAEVIIGLIGGSDLITGQTIVVDGGSLVGSGR